jgi:peptidoglycan hydrolase CwlO-like protein
MNNQIEIPLSDTEEAVYQLMKQLHLLQGENEKLKEEIKRLQWTLTEHD